MNLIKDFKNCLNICALKFVNYTERLLKLMQYKAYILLMLTNFTKVIKYLHSKLSILLSRFSQFLFLFIRYS